MERETGPALAGGWDCVRAGCEEVSGRQFLEISDLFYSYSKLLDPVPKG